MKSYNSLHRNTWIRLPLGLGKWGGKLLPIALVLVVALGCEQLANSEPRFLGKLNGEISPIGEVQNQTQNSPKVNLQGRAIALAPFSQGGAYLLQDSTGEIWVTTQRDLPAQGEEVAIAGQVEYRSIAVEGQEFGEVYVRELKQLTPKK